MNVARIEIFGMTGIGEVTTGADLADLIMSGSSALGGLRDGDIVVVTSKIVSKAEGRGVELATVTPSPFA